MYKYKILSALMISMVMVSAAYGQEKPENHPVQSVTGIVTGTDSVGNTISIQTDGQQQMTLSVPDKAVISQETHNIGLMDIGKSDSVIIKYYVAPSSKNTVVSIVDNESVVNE